MSQCVDKCDLWVFAFQFLENVVEMGNILWSHILVTYLHIFQREGLRVSCFSAHLSPFVTHGVCQSVVDGITEVLYHGIHVCIAAHEITVANRARHACIVDKHGIHVQVFAEL